MIELSKQRVLVIAPHLDDEVIGCGGLISKVKEQGGKVFVLFLANGDTKDVSKRGYSTKSERERELESVAKYLDFDDYTIAFGGNNHHLKLDSIPQLEIISEIETKSSLSIYNIKPTLIVTVDPRSYNQDHKAAALASFAACRPASNNLKPQPHIFLTYESPADQWSNKRRLQTPNFFVEINRQILNKKIKALKLYKSQLRKHPNPRSVKSITSTALLRGAQCGTYYAEGFYCHKVHI